MNGRLSNSGLRSRPMPDMDGFVKENPELSFSLGDIAAYQRLRIVESALVSCFDDPSQFDEKKLQVLTLHKGKDVLGVTSFGVFSNSKRAGASNLYARIDLVITEKRWRNLGVARALVIAVLVYVLEIYGKRLYSISCLAAHERVVRILENLSFVGENRDEKGFKHEKLDLEAIDRKGYLEKLRFSIRRIYTGSTRE